jgi:hypothetical protein
MRFNIIGYNEGEYDEKQWPYLLGYALSPVSLLSLVEELGPYWDHFEQINISEAPEEVWTPFDDVPF